MWTNVDASILLMKIKSVIKYKVIYLYLAGGLGFEPRLAESESAVLPLDDPPMEAAL